MRYYALACDYDGTLAHDGRVKDSTVAALERLRESGRRLIMVTGREMRDLFEIFSRLDLFEWIVAENGALLYRPSTREERLLGEAPPAAFVEMLAARGVREMSVGHGIVATWVPYESVVLSSIRDLGLDLQVIFNKGAVMVLPSGVNKASGLLAALKEMRLSPRNVVSVGDAENDHAMLKLCECGVAVSNALPTVKETADYATDGDHGDGVVELIDMMVDNDLAALESRLRRRDFLLGTLKDDSPVAISPHGLSLMIAGTSGSGKSTLTTGLIERLQEQGYQFCLIDPEGDYQDLPGTITLGDSKRPPTVTEVLQLLERPDQSGVVSLVGVAMEHRPEFFGKLLPALTQLRHETGRPHWIIVDEAHHLLPTTWAPAAAVVPSEFDGLILITVHPEHVAAQVVANVDLVLAIGAAPAETIGGFSRALGVEPPSVPDVTLQPGEGIAWQRTPPRDPFWFRSIPPKAERRRHRRKYAEGEIEEERVFYFRGPENKLKLRAQNLMVFLQLADGVDDDTWLHHLQAGDYARWFRTTMNDAELAAEAEAVARDESLSPDESRARIRSAVETRYCGPA
ncbi:MAG: HAD-IIB family hydrolase [Planctomycetaceae bacterium]|nr:HAD-IIB family hydrolase [Planctomycetaceae bacterium]